MNLQYIGNFRNSRIFLGVKSPLRGHKGGKVTHQILDKYGKNIQ